MSFHNLLPNRRFANTRRRSPAKLVGSSYEDRSDCKPICLCQRNSLAGFHFGSKPC
jgi:hypothetical protein